MRHSLVRRDTALCNIARGLKRVAEAVLINAGASVEGKSWAAFTPRTDDPNETVREQPVSHVASAPLKLSPSIAEELSKTTSTKDVRYKRVPSTRMGRAAGFASLFVQLGWDRLSQTVPSAGFLSDSGHTHIVETLCRMRGAVLKLGQMLSIQDGHTIPPHVTAIFERVRDQAFAMPLTQLNRTLTKEFGDPGWRSAVFASFDDAPVAAASIGQVHRATLRPGVAGTDPAKEPVEVAVKVQYPGVAKSIDSDVANLKMLISAGVLPPGMFVDKVLQELRNELHEECQYTLEAAKQRRYRDLVLADPTLSSVFSVPQVFEAISTDQVLVTDYVRGVPIDQLGKRSDIPQELCNFIAGNFMNLTLKELFDWRFMQTDPNFSNFLYNVDNGEVHLLDFGAAREFSSEFVADYLDVVAAAATGDRQTIVDKSVKLGFLTGQEAPEMIEAHCASVLLLGKPFEDRKCPFDFAAQNLPKLIQAHVPTIVRLRLRPPPTPVYSLHRRLSGTILLATKFKATIPSGRQFWDLYEHLRGGERKG